MIDRWFWSGQLESRRKWKIESLTPSTRTFRLKAEPVWKFANLAMVDTTWDSARSRCCIPLRTFLPWLLRRGV